MVEFAIIALVFFIFLFGIIEFARFLFTYNTLTEMLRRGARIAAVCPPNHPAIKRAAIFGNPTAGTTGYFVPNLTTANIQLRYLDSSGNALTNLTYPIPGTPSTTYLNEWDALNLGGTIEVSLINYSYRLLIPLIPGPVTAPTFSTKLPPEALGVVNAPGTTGTGTDLCGFPP